MEVGSEKLERYLDGLLFGEERVRVERQVAGDARLAAEVNVQFALNEALARLFIPPDLDAVAARVYGHVLSAPRRKRLFAGPGAMRRTLAVAALIAVSVVSGYRTWVELWPARGPNPYAPQPWRSFERVYGDEVAEGLKPLWVCKDNREFETAFKRRFRQTLAIVPPPPGIAWAGVDYCNCITPSTMTVLGYVNGREVVVFVDRAEDDKEPSRLTASNLHLFRQEIGRFVLYECTPWDHPGLLGLFYSPDVMGP